MKPPTASHKLLQALALPLALLLGACGMLLVFNPVSFANYGHNGDLFPRWYGTVAAFSGTSPYSAEVSGEIQRTFHGHALAPGEEKDEQRFANPAYVIFLLWPLTTVDFWTVKIISALAMVGMIMVLPLLWLDALGRKARLRSRLAMSFFLLGLVPTIHALRLQQLAIPVVLFVTLGFLFIRRGQLAWAGAAFALSTIKPQMALAPLLWLAIWIAGDWKGRWKLAAGFVATLAALSFGAELIVPGWIPQFVDGLRAYGHYADTRPLLVFLLGGFAGGLAVAGVLAFFLASAARSRRYPASTPEFAGAMALSFCVGALCVPAIRGPYNHLLLIPAVLVVADKMQGIAGRIIFLALLVVPTLIAAANNILQLPATLVVSTALVMECVPPLCIAVAMIVVEARSFRDALSARLAFRPDSSL